MLGTKPMRTFRSVTVTEDVERMNVGHFDAQKAINLIWGERLHLPYDPRLPDGGHAPRYRQRGWSLVVAGATHLVRFLLFTVWLGVIKVCVGSDESIGRSIRHT